MVIQKKIFYLLIILYGLFTITNQSLAQVRIAVLYSRISEQLSTTNSQNIIEEITSWELLLMQNKIPYKVIYDNDLESGIEDEFDILILPSVKFISKAEFEELNNFLEAGKSIISVGSKLFNSENSTYTFQNLETLFGLRNIENISAESISFLHSISSNQLNHFVTDDDRVLQISTSNEPLMCDEIENTSLAYGYVILEGDFISKQSSIIYGTAGKGKYLWAGFELNNVFGGKNDLEQFKNLILNSIKWMDNDPDVYLAVPWTEGLRPLFLTLEFNSALEPEFVEVLQKNKFNPNLVVNPQQKISTEVLRKFSEDQIFLDLSGNLSDQYDNSESVVNLITTFERDNEIQVSSIILNKSFIENNDIKSLSNIGIENILLLCKVTGNPKQNSGDLFILPFSKTGIKSTLHGPVRFIHYTPQINCDTNSEDDFLTMINQLDRTQSDFTSLGEISKWWNSKNKLDATIISGVENSIEVLVANKNPIEVNNLQIYVNPNNIIDNRNISVTSDNLLISHYFQQSSGTIVISLDKLLPKSNKKITISFSDN